MSKDVIYIEPDDDITDVISKVKGAKTNIVALVPPKKAGVFRSIVNIKLIAKSAAAAEKTVVLVTTDPSIIKLAAATRMPVTKDLNSAPQIPEAEDADGDTEVVDVDDEAEDVEPEEDEDNESSEEDDDHEETDDSEEDSEDETEVEDTAESTKSTKNAGKKSAKGAEIALNDDTGEDEDEEPEDGAPDGEVAPKGQKRARRDSKANKRVREYKGSDRGGKEYTNRLAQSSNPVLHWIGTHPKITSGIGVGLIGVIILAIWAFAIAPAVKITLELETTTGNFSENITFTQKLADEKVSEGKFYIDEKKIESKNEVEFEATGKKNVGEKASGTIKVTHYFPLDEEGGTVAINNGATFTNSGLTFVVTSGANIRWDGDLTTVAQDCENSATAGWRSRGCAVSATVTVTAAESGVNYNISSTSSGWSTSVGGLDIITNNAMTGGSDKTVTIVQQSDIDKAMQSISSDNEASNKEKLEASIEKGQFEITSSFKKETGNPVSSPAVGEEVADGKKAKLTVTTTYSIFTVDETKLIEFITEKAKLEDGYKIYEMSDPFIENFLKTDSGYMGKLKTSYIYGSTITENEVVDTVKGKGIGSAKRDLSDNFSGIKSITIDTSVPWVTTVPGNTEKITVKIEVKE